MIVGIGVDVTVVVIVGVTVCVDVFVATWAAERTVLLGTCVEVYVGVRVADAWAATDPTDQKRRPNANTPTTKQQRINVDITPRLSAHVVIPFDEESPYFTLKNRALWPRLGL